MASELVSVIVPMYNCAGFISRTIESVSSQIYGNIEILLIDDGSDDNTSEVCSELISTANNIYYFKKENGGVASARNFGIRKAKGEYIAFCDHDDVWDPEKLALQIERFADPGVGLVYGRGSGTRYEGRCYRELLLYNCIPCSSVMVRRSCFDAAGLFDERREMNGVDDKHMWIRVAMEYDVVVVGRDLYAWGISGRNYSLQQHKMLEAELCCAKDILGKYAGMFTKSDIKSTFYNIYSHYANNYIYINDYTNAKKHCRNALKYSWDTKTAAWFMLMYLPDFVLNTLKLWSKLLR